MAEAWYFISPAGTTYQLDDVSANRVLESADGLGLPPVNNLTAQGAQQDGATWRGARLKPRVVSAVFTVQNSSRQLLWDEHQTWAQAFKPFATAGILRVQKPDNTQYELDVRYHGGLNMGHGTPDALNPTTQKYAVQWIAYDPVWRKLPLNTQTFTLAALTKITFPITFPITFGGSVIDESVIATAGGTWKTYPTITLTGPLTNITLTNNTTGKLISLQTTIAAGRVVTINLAPGVKTITDDLGTNLIGYLSAASDLSTFYLATAPEVSGGNNTIRVQASAATGASGIAISWYDKLIAL